MTEKHFVKDDVIFREGQSGSTLYEITGGDVAIFANYEEFNQQKLTELGKGQFFGEMAVVEGYPRSATAVALGNVSAVEISVDEIEAYFGEQPGRIVDIMRNLSRRIRELTDDYDEVCRVISELTPGEGKNDRSTSLAGKLKRFADCYIRNKNTANAISYEQFKKVDRVLHTEGYSANVDTLPEGKVVFREGDKGICMYNIHSGKVGIFRNYGTSGEICLTELEADQFFGEMGMLDGAERSATAVVTEDGTVLETIFADDLKEIFEKDPSKVSMILRHMSNRLRKLTISYLEACRLIYDIVLAEDTDSVDEEIKDRTANYRADYYG